MTVTFFFNYLNRHQLPVADEMYKLLGDNFKFVATYPISVAELKGGKDYSDRQYCLLAAVNDADDRLAHHLNVESDVCVYGAGNLAWEKERAQSDKLSFEVSERWLKRGLVNLLSPRLLKWWWLYQTKLRGKRFYKLCASAYAASDCKKLGAFYNRCYKWGYFTEMSSERESFVVNKPVNILWCARFIHLKHPELIVELAERLKDECYDFVIKMYGDGELRSSIENQIQEKNLAGYIKLMGNVSNEDVQKAMSEGNIFLFTSDKNEGWGAVVNEAMGNGCCVVGSDVIGSVPFLVRHGENGLMYKGSQGIESLYENVKFLLDNPAVCAQMAQTAYNDMRNVWSAEKAAKNLLQLIDNIVSGETVTIKNGPCSNA